MKQRCQNPRCSAYRNYGARGITVCDAWQAFEPFCYWALENGYQKGLDLDRIDNDGQYSPTNCQWTTRSKNTRNRRMSLYLTVNGERKHYIEWAEITGIRFNVINSWVLKHDEAYAESRIAEAIENGYTPHDYRRNHKCQPVRCVETDRVFPSLKEASRVTGIGFWNIVNAAKRNGRAGGYHWVLA